jgi:exopolysaccharide production protein ExoZ
MRVFTGIQYLRGLAATAVLLFHLSERFGGELKVGSAGVDVFFVISGFIMWVTTAGKKWSPQQFMGRRFIRIVPLYWIVIGVTALAILLRPQFLFGHDLSTHNFFGSLFFFPDVTNDEFHPVVLQGWTLTYEMAFYVVFGIALLGAEQIRFWAIGAAFTLFVLLQPVIGNDKLHVLANPIILEFLFGVAIGRLWLSGFRVPVYAAAGLMLLSALALASTDYIAPSLPRLIRWGVPGALLVAGSVFAESIFKNRSFAPLRLLGDASYSIYLWHILAIAALDGLLLKVKLPWPFHVIGVGLLALGLTVVLYFLIEKPLVQFFVKIARNGSAASLNKAANNQTSKI